MKLSNAISRRRTLSGGLRKTAATSFSIVILIALTVGFAVLAIGPFRDRQTHQVILTKLRSLDFNSASLQRDVLRARVGLLENYDSLVKSIVALHKDLAELRSLIGGPETVKGDFIPDLLDKVQASIDRDETEIEKFKTQNALLRNSLRIFGRTLSDFHQDGSVAARSKATAAGDLGNLMMRYALDDEERTADLISDNLTALSSIGDQVPAARPLVMHGRMILSILPQLRSIITNVQNSDTVYRAQRLQQEYLNDYEITNTRSQWSRLFLGTASVLLCLYVVVLVSKLRNKTDGLSRRLGFEGMIKEINRCFQDSENDDPRFNSAMIGALEAVRQFFEGRRCGLVIVNSRAESIEERYGDKVEIYPEHELIRATAPERENVIYKNINRIVDKDVSEDISRSGVALSVKLPEEIIATCIIEFDHSRKKPPADEAVLLENITRTLLQIFDFNRRQKEREALEKRLEHAERLQAVGTLAGGIAHEFNNILVAILGYGEMALDLLKQSPTRRYVEEIVRAAERSRLIIDQILALSRKRERTVKPFDLVEAVEDMRPLLRVSLSSGVDLVTDLPPHACVIEGSRIDIQQILVNLCKNAAESMDAPGKIIIRVRQTSLTSLKISSHGVIAPGDYIMLSVQDHGKGIPASILPKIFEPFFTTRNKSGGTGLGLAAVHGNVTALGGNIDVTSTPGAGTTFDIFLPLSSQAPIGVQEVFNDEDVPLGNGETIFVLDDNAATRAGYEDQLAALGYEPIGYRSWGHLHSGMGTAGKADLVLIDVDSLPTSIGSRDISGLFGAVPFCLITAQPESIQFRMGNGQFAPVLRKPLASRALAAAIRVSIEMPP